MVNRYAGEIHLNPIANLRGGDFNNDGRIDDINLTLTKAIDITREIEKKLSSIRLWLKSNDSHSARFHFADGGYISIEGLPDIQLKALSGLGLIQLYDFAVDKNWVKKFGHHVGLIWKDGQAIDI
jgi:hypothetical protein